MKYFLSLLLCCLCFITEAKIKATTLRSPNYPTLSAQLGAARTNMTLNSEELLLKARKFFPVMRTPEGEIVNDDGVVGDKISAQAIDELAKDATELSAAADTAMQEALRYLQDAMKDVARDSVGIAIAFAPENDVTNLTVYVAHEETDGITDTFYFWFSKQVSMQPNLYMSYEYYGGAATQKVSFARWNTTTNVVDGRGRTWEGCHKGTVQRPTFARMVTCITEPNIPLGGASGMDFGGAIILDEDDMQPFLTCEVTNTVDKTVIRFQDGAVMEYFGYE